MRLKQVADVAEGAPERVERSRLGLAQVCLDLGKGLFDRVAMMPLNDCFLLTFSLLAGCELR
ncbi:hypothetical protein ILT44_29845, partial [Microvirga sp. BT689]|uniref:hypothetical protein n=1 Tax=Microvirga arvi TaxID=2778731 RepID=UPI00194F22AC|nr:hypothetical protein [Microvirga arvi]